MRRLRAQVAIIGAGPAGLILAALLHRAGIESVVLEDRSRDYVEARIRAGVLEQGTVELLERAGVTERLHAEAIVHGGIHLQFDGERHHVPMDELTGGRRIVIYGQTEVVKDLIAARLDDGLPLLFEVNDVSVHGFDGDEPYVRFEHDGEEHRLDCDVIAGCDGFHGICRPAIQAISANVHARVPLRLARDPCRRGAVERGARLREPRSRVCALLSLRSPTRSRLYIQCAPDEDIVELAGRAHLGGVAGAHRAGGLDASRRGGAREGSHRDAQLRRRADAARAAVPRRRRSAHRPADRSQGAQPRCARRTRARRRAVEWYAEAAATRSTPTRRECLRRVWRAEHFSWWMTAMLHNTPGADEFDRKLQLSQLRYVTTSTAAATSLAENYVGLERV